jgi:hypothetical protein
MNTITNRTIAIDCPKCKAPHFNHQLTCKRCGEYLHREEVLPVSGEHTLAIAGGILGVSTVILVVCLALHMF